MSEFSDWLNKAIEAKAAKEKREITLGMIAEGTGLKPSSLSELKSGKCRPKYESCLVLARYFEEDPRPVLVMAGHKIGPPWPVLKVVSVDVKSAGLRMHLRRVTELPKEAQDSLARIIAPIIDHIEEDTRQINSTSPLSSPGPKRPLTEHTLCDPDIRRRAVGFSPAVATP